MKFDWKRDLRRLLLVIVGSVIIAVNLKMFVRPAGLYPGGANGLSMLMQTIFSTYLGVSVPFTVFNVLFNSIPAYIGLRFLGRKFTILSIITIVLSSVLTDLLPDLSLTSDPLLNCVFGGILFAFASSLCHRRHRFHRHVYGAEVRPRCFQYDLRGQRHHAGRGRIPVWLG